VLLLDEGDVFLERRTIHDLERNRLVSVFLRTLEYFDGVLFLTTNRLKDFDNAFESRIDFSIEYPELDFESRLQVWKNLISRLKRPVDISSSDLEKLARIEMNGRRVKNVIKSAQLIAAGDNGSAVRISHVETVLKVVSTKSMV
jgi:AAA+ superfamily predicted ATPase